VDVGIAWVNGFSASGCRPGLVMVVVVVVCQQSGRGSSQSAWAVIWWSALAVAALFLRPSLMCVL
jgi:hypothetical protein